MPGGVFALYSLRSQSINDCNLYKLTSTYGAVKHYALKMGTLDYDESEMG